MLPALAVAACIATGGDLEVVASILLRARQVPVFLGEAGDHTLIIARGVDNEIWSILELDSDGVLCLRGVGSRSELLTKGA